MGSGKRPIRDPLSGERCIVELMKAPEDSVGFNRLRSDSITSRPHQRRPEGSGFCPLVRRSAFRDSEIVAPLDS